MKILLAPSETKRAGGSDAFNMTSLLFSSLSVKRNRLLHAYTNILQKGDMEVLSKMFGLKKPNDILYYQQDIIYQPTMKAIERYTGVAFEYLNYTNLSLETQKYIDTTVIIFSNLFGAIRADDQIPEYRLKQGEKVGDIRVEKFYQQESSLLLDEYFANEEILDLRAIFYEKFYKPIKPYTTLKFIKDGKVVSHWAKAYRGIVLQHIAKAKINTIDEFIKLPIENLSIVEIQTKKNQTKIVYEIG